MQNLNWMQYYRTPNINKASNQIYNGKIFSFGLRVRSAFTLEFAIFVNALSGTTIQNEQSSKSDKHQNGMVHMVITLE